jgi:hypothetical protein
MFGPTNVLPLPTAAHSVVRQCSRCSALVTRIRLALHCCNDIYSTVPSVVIGILPARTSLVTPHQYANAVNDSQVPPGGGRGCKSRSMVGLNSSPGSFSVATGLQIGPEIPRCTKQSGPTSIKPRAVNARPQRIEGMNTDIDLLARIYKIRIRLCTTTQHPHLCSRG